MSLKETQDKLLQKTRSCCENEANFQKHSPYLIEKAQSGDEFFKTPLSFNLLNI